MKLQRRIVIAALSLVSIVALVGCAKKGSTGSTGSGGKDRVTYWNQWIGPPNGVGPQDSEYLRAFRTK